MYYINLFGYFIRIIRNLMRIIIIIQVIMVRIFVLLIFYRLRFVFISLSSGNLLIFVGLGLDIDSFISFIRMDLIEGCKRNLFQRFGLMLISLFMRISFIFFVDLIQSFYILVKLSAYFELLSFLTHQFAAFNADIWPQLAFFFQKKSAV